MTTTYPYEDIAADAAATGRPVYRILDAGETAWNPGSTKADLVGPLRVTYQQFPDGGWTASASPRPQGKARR